MTSARGFAAFPKMKRRVATTWWGKAWVTPPSTSA